MTTATAPVDTFDLASDKFTDDFNPIQVTTDEGVLNQVTVRITSIDFDWEADEEQDELSDEQKQVIVDGIKSRRWELPYHDGFAEYEGCEEEELITSLTDSITEETGWCVEGLEYDFLVQ